MARIISRVRSRQPPEWAPQASAEFRRVLDWVQETTKDDTSHAIRIDPSSCVECGRCSRACKELQGLGLLKLDPNSLLNPISASDEGCKRNIFP